MLLYERGEYREAAAFIRRVSSPTYRQIVTELPIDRFVDAMPHSMPVLEAIYAKVGMDSFQKTDLYVALTLYWSFPGLPGIKHRLSPGGRPA